MPDFPSGPSPRRELQGPRPTPLKVRKDSHKIRKPPIVAPPPPEHQPHHTHAPPRPPVIIYTVSPKIIHANPNEFMSLVQRLTGPDSSSCTSSSSSSAYVFQENIRVISPEVCFASIEKTKSPDGRKTKVFHHHDMGLMVEDIEIGNELNQRTGILSPNPNALPPIPPKIFSSTISDSNPLSFFHDLSPVSHSNRNYSLENNFIMPSPSFISPHMINYMPSPNTLDLLNTLYDL